MKTLGALKCNLFYPPCTQRKPQIVNYCGLRGLSWLLSRKVKKFFFRSWAPVQARVGNLVRADSCVGCLLRCLGLLLSQLHSGSQLPTNTRCGKQQVKLIPVVGSLLPIWETQTKFLAALQHLPLPILFSAASLIDISRDRDKHVELTL